jgi:hypothetical protein
VNASEQAKGVELASKIATIVNLFKTEFPDAKSDLKPWHNDPNTRELVDPDSIDIAFHFPGWSRRFQCRSMLVQIRFDRNLTEEKAKAIGLEIAGFTYDGESWRLSTVENWQIIGKNEPVEEVTLKLKHFCRQVFELFR